METNTFCWSSSIDSYRTKPVLRSPTFIGDFSLDEERNFHLDKRCLKFLHHTDLSGTREVSFDLDFARHKAKSKNFEETKNEKLDNLLRWILHNKSKFVTGESTEKSLKSLSTDFICFRGLLTELLCTPYEFKEGWIIHATRYAGTIYLMAIEAEEKKLQRLNETDRQKQMCSWGYKFEQYMSDEDPRTGVDENSEYCCVLRSRLDKHSLVYGAEIDGANKKLYHDRHSDLLAFVELKTCRKLENTRMLTNFHRFRMKKWWAQSYLVGVPSLICGFRDDDGIVHSLKNFKVSEMPRLAKSHWNRNVMLNFVDDFLTWLKMIVIEDDASFVYEFIRHPGERKITVSSLNSQPESSSRGFLPHWYTKNIFSS